MKLDKNLYTKFVSLNIAMMQFGYIKLSEGISIRFFFQNLSGSSISDSIAWNLTKSLLAVCLF